MKAHITFSIELPYVQTEYSLLKGMAVEVKNLGHSRFLWTFRAEDIEKVIKTLGKPIECDLTPLIPYAPAMKEVVEDKSRKKGKGYFIVTFRSPKIYIIETIINAKTVTKRIPTESIKAAWLVMKKYPIGKPIQTSTVAENICKELGITRFNRPDSHTWDFAKFFGSRAEYYKYFYAPIKVLQAEKAIIHHTDGHVERIAEHWELQTEFTEAII
jgi:hypothetical protein